MELSYISGSGNPKKLLILQEVTFCAQRVSYISGGASKAPKTKMYYTFPKKVINKFS